MKWAHLSASTSYKDSLGSGIGHSCHAKLASDHLLWHLHLLILQTLLLIRICSYLDTYRCNILEVDILIDLLELEVVSYEVGSLGTAGRSLASWQVLHQVILLCWLQVAGIVFAQNSAVLAVLTAIDHRTSRISLLHADFALWLGTRGNIVSLVRGIFLKVTAHMFKVLLSAVVCLGGWNIEVCASGCQTCPLSLRPWHLKHSLHHGCLIGLHQIFYVSAIHTVREQVLLVLGAAVRRRAHRLDCQTKIRIHLLVVQQLLMNAAAILLRRIVHRTLWIVLRG